MVLTTWQKKCFYRRIMDTELMRSQLTETKERTGIKRLTISIRVAEDNAKKIEMNGKG